MSIFLYTLVKYYELLLFHMVSINSDLENLPKTRRRSPYPESSDIIVFLRKDIERK